jgi:predicted DNA-binding protein with PD1-like motif
LFKKIHVFRVKPQQELLAEIASYCNKYRISSGVIIGIIGSAEKVRLSYLVKIPGEYQSVEYSGPLEIVCAQGSIAKKEDELIIHIHIQISNQECCRGGHLSEAIVFSTAEVIIGEIDYQLFRNSDKYTGLNELVNGNLKK